MKRALLVGLGLVLVGGVVTPVVTPAGVDLAAAATGAAMPFDFDGDGFADLAVGVPGEDLRGKRDVGAVQVLYGSASGVTAHDQLWHQGRKGVKGALESRDSFGFDLASGDFNADGYADVAISIPGENIRGKANAGAVQVLYGSPAGLTASGDQVWHQGKKGVPGSNEKGDRFGEQLAVGDFDGDGYADLVVGVPAEDMGKTLNAGRIVVLRGSVAGLTAAAAQSWGEGSAGIASEPLNAESFGGFLAAGDVNGDGRDDLAIGVHENAPDIDSAVHLLLGSTRGLTAADSQFFRLTDLGLPRTPWLDSLWFGDVNADGHDDLALGTSTSGVALLHGHTDGLRPSLLPTQGQPGKDTMWPGYAGPAASGDFTGDGHADLAMIGTLGDAMSVVIGTSKGLGSDIAQWSPPQWTPGGFGNPSYLPFNVLPLSGGPHVWLVAGGLKDTYIDSGFKGAVIVLQGTRSGEAGPATLWHQDSPGIKGSAESGDHFGETVGGTSPGIWSPFRAA